MVGDYADEFYMSVSSDSFRRKHYSDVNKNEWDDYRWQLRKRLQNSSELQQFINLSTNELRALSNPNRKFSVSITPYYLSLIDQDNLNDPLRRTVIPTTDEFQVSYGESNDPLGEDENSPVPGIVHRYPDRVLFLVTDFCPVYCRYCTRSRLVGGKASFDINLNQWTRAIKYIKSTPQIRDVLVSGGDPLIYSNERLEWLLQRFRSIPHVEIIRLGTKIPFVLPQRITADFINMVKKYHPIYMSLHVIHPNEVTPESSQACEKLADGGIPLGSQTVLLQGINDDIETQQTLMHSLLKIRVKPYYLLQCDTINGSKHFRTPIEKGIEIIQGLRGHTSGYAVPHYIIDLPGGGGKVSLVPDHITGREKHDTVFKNFQGTDGFRYPNFIE